VVLVKRLFDTEKIETLDRRLIEFVVGEELPYLEDIFCPNVNPRKLKGQGISHEGIVRLKVISYLFKHFKSPDINNKILNEKDIRSIKSQKKIDKTLRYTNDDPNTTTMKIETLQEIAKNNNWKAFLFVHNHPNGNSTPSGADVDFTNKVAKIMEEANKPVLDHIIIGKNNYFSFYENNTE
jgi:hypothetical protein